MITYNLEITFEATHEEAADEVIANIIASNEEREGITDFELNIVEYV